MSASAGRVLLLFKGDYSAGTTYVPMDCVYYNGGSYVCKAETTGNLPTNTTYWQVLAQKGADGGVPSGGTTGQVVTKASNTDYDVEWADTFSIEDARDAEVIPSKNLLPITLSSLKAIYNNTSGTWTGNTYALGNATFQVVTNTNGYVEKIVINSTSNTNDVSLWLNFRGYTSENNLAGCIVSDIYTGNSNRDVFQAYRIGNKSSGAYIDRLVDTTGAITIPTLTSEQDGSLCVTVKASTTVSNVEYYPMICTQEEWSKSHDYEPYYIPLKNSKLDIADEQVLGAWNLVENTATSQTLSGVIWTVNADGTITANNTQTAKNAFTVNGGFKVSKSGYYFISGCPTGGSLPTYHLYIRNITDSENVSGDDFGNGAWVYLDSSKTYAMLIWTVSGVVYNNHVFKPMLALKPNQPYVPYCMTNQELTDYNNGFNFLKFLGNTGNAIYNGDLNNLNAGYVYYQNSATHIPSAEYGYCLTLDRPSVHLYAVQIAITNSCKFYVRNKDNGTWQAWKQVSLS